MAQEPDPGHQPPLEALLTQGYTAPRFVMRSLLLRGVEEGERLIMVAISVIVTFIGYIASGAMEQAAMATELPPPSPSLLLIVFLLSGLIQYRLVSLLVHRLGRAFGGVADAVGSRTAIAWWMMITAPIQGFYLLLSGGSQSGIWQGLFFAMVGLTLWLMSACIAEAHRFRNTLAVFGAVLGSGLLIGMLLGSLVAGLAPPPL